MGAWGQRHRPALGEKTARIRTGEDFDKAAGLGRHGQKGGREFVVAAACFAGRGPGQRLGQELEHLSAVQAAAADEFRQRPRCDIHGARRGDLSFVAAGAAQPAGPDQRRFDKRQPGAPILCGPAGRAPGRIPAKAAPWQCAAQLRQRQKRPPAGQDDRQIGGQHRVFGRGCEKGAVGGAHAETFRERVR